MTRDEVAIMLGTMREIYGKQSDAPNPEFLITLWYRYLCDEPPELVQQAFDAYVAKNVFAPKPAEILELLEKARWQIYEKKIVAEQTGGTLRIPDAYLPRSITRKPKQFEVENEARLLKQLGGSKIGQIAASGESTGRNA